MVFGREKGGVSPRVPWGVFQEKSQVFLGFLLFSKKKIVFFLGAVELLIFVARRYFPSFFRVFSNRTVLRLGFKKASLE